MLLAGKQVCRFATSILDGPRDYDRSQFMSSSGQTESTSAPHCGLNKKFEAGRGRFFFFFSFHQKLNLVVHGSSDEAHCVRAAAAAPRSPLPPFFLSFFSRSRRTQRVRRSSPIRMLPSHSLPFRFGKRRRSAAAA